MSKSLKKILVTGASLLMFASVGASSSQVVNPIHASRTTTRIARLRARRSRDYRDIKSINAQLNKLEHKNGRKARPRRVRKARKPRVQKHESLAEWYKNNSRRMRWNDMRIKDFHTGYDSGKDNYDYDASMSPDDNITTNAYKHGWIIGYATNNGRRGSVKDFTYGIHYYNDGVAYDKSEQPSNLLILTNGEWNETD